MQEGSRKVATINRSSHVFAKKKWGKKALEEGREWSLGIHSANVREYGKYLIRPCLGDVTRGSKNRASPDLEGCLWGKESEHTKPQHLKRGRGG